MALLHTGRRAAGGKEPAASPCLKAAIAVHGGILSGLFFIVSYCQAQPPPRLVISAGTGWETEDLHWSIAGRADGTGPDVLSELKWKSVSGPLTQLDLDAKIRSRLSVSAHYGRQFTVAGHVTDRDYQGDHRTRRTYDGRFAANRGVGSDAALFLSWQLTPIESSFCARLGAGFHYRGGRLTLRDPGGPFSSLHSRYDYRWEGPAVALDVLVAPPGKSRLRASVSYCQAVYRAKADWNLITTFAHPVSFAQDARGFLLGLGTVYTFRISSVFGISAAASTVIGKTGIGRDHLYLQDGDSDGTRLNGVGMGNLEAHLGLQYDFH